MSDPELLEIIGKGSFGVIRKIQRPDGKILARKEIDFRKMNDREKRQLVNEVNILRELRHPNIVRYYERIVDREACMIYIVMEYCEGGDLAAIIRRCRKEGRFIPESVIWLLFIQLLQALSECHMGQSGKMILHRDIKPDNVFLDSDQNVKLGDFGLSRMMDHDDDKGFTEEFGVEGVSDSQRRFAKTFVGTPFYMSPELIDERGYDARSDIWSLGCLLYELAALEYVFAVQGLIIHRPPFQASTQSGLNAKIRSGRFPELPRQYSEDLTAMVKWMLKVDVRFQFEN
jgi:serine/threonine protein kinase